MRLSSPDHKQPNSPSAHLPWQLLKAVFLIFLACLTTYIIINFLSLHPQKKFFTWAKKHGYGIYDTKFSAIYPSMSAVFQKKISLNDVPKIVIDINFKSMQMLYKKRSEALKKGILIQEKGDLVPAKIRYLDQTIKVKLRLKGDWTDHLVGDKWSFRIKVKGKKQLFGLRRFSIQNPKVRGYQGEALFFETLKHVGVLAPRYFFVDVVINGKKIGIMALEEHFSKELLEANERREGVIVRFDESLLWRARAAKGNGYNDYVFNNYNNATIDGFRSSKIKKSKKLSSDYAVAVGLLRSFKSGSIPPAEIFDVELMGKYLAVVELWGARHSVVWHNQRFYLNPITLKLEPIGFDANVDERKAVNSLAGQEEPFVISLLQDPEIFSVFHETLKQLADEVLNGDLIATLEKVQEEALEVLHTEYLFLGSFPMDYLRERAKYLLSVTKKEFKTLKINVNNFPEIVNGFIVTDVSGSYLELVNLIPHKVQVSDITCASDSGNSLVSLRENFDQLSLPLLLPPTLPRTLSQATRLYFSSGIPKQCKKIKISATIQGQKKEYQIKAIAYYPELKDHPLPRSDIQSQLSMHNFLVFDRNHNRLAVRPGKWQVHKAIIIPKGYSFEIPAGTILQFDTGAGVFSYGTMELSGTVENPIILEGIDEENKIGTWQGVVVMDASEPSIWKNVSVRNTTGIKQLSWQLTGGVTFYKSNITMESCSLMNNKGEDALNIIRSEFLLKNITISNTASDAFDSDYSNGSVEGGLFENIGSAGGGDAIDISGSNVEVRGTKFVNIDDKALSVGEKSVMNAISVDVVTTGTGAASKDGSILTIKDSSIRFAKNASLMAYIKKPEFGPARIIATGMNLLSDVVDARVQEGSSIIIDGVEVESEDVNVKKLYETSMKPGLR